MKKGRESIDIFKIYKENKLHPSIKQNHEIKDFHRDDNIKIRNKTPILKRIVMDFILIAYKII